MKRRLHLATTVTLLFVAIAAASTEQRVSLLPRLRAGQTITYLIRFQSVKKIKTESNVAVPFAPDSAQIDAQGLLRLEILEVQPFAGRPVVRARARFLTLGSAVPATKPNGMNSNENQNRSDPTDNFVQFIISSDGFFEQVSGLDALSQDQQQVWQEWAARFAAAWALPAQSAKPGDKWKSEQSERTPSPIAALAWANDSSYVRNEPCRPSAMSTTGEFSPANGPSDTCAVLLTKAKLTQKSSAKDATPEDYKLHELKTSGTAKGANEIITYISLTTGLVVRATEETSQQMDLVVAKADGSNRVHYTVGAASRSEVLLITETPLASP